MKYFILLLLILCSASHANEPLKNNTYKSPTLLRAFRMETVIDANIQKEYCAYPPHDSIGTNIDDSIPRIDCECPFEQYKKTDSDNKISKIYCVCPPDKRAKYINVQKNILRTEPYIRKPFDYNQEAEFKRKKEMEDKLLYDPKDYPEQEAAFKLGVIYAGLPCKPPQFDEALKYFSLSGNNPKAQFGAAVIFYKQNKDLRAYDLLVTASKRGVAEASYNVAVMLWKQNRVKFQKHIKFHLEKAGDGGYKRAYSDLSMIFMAEARNHTTDIQDTKNKVLTFLNKAADAKDMYGLYNRAVFHFFQGCVKQNAISIVNDLYDAAIQRFVPALEALKFLETQKCTMALSKERLEKLRLYNAHYHTYISPSFDPFNKLLYQETPS